MVAVALVVLPVPFHTWLKVCPPGNRHCRVQPSVGVGLRLVIVRSARKASVHS
jgi:hypothetical protein